METEILSTVTDAEAQENAVYAGTGGLLETGEVVQGYTVQKLLSTAGGEAEIYLCEKDSRIRVLKYFYNNRGQDSEILQKLFSFSGNPGIIAYIDSGVYKDRYFLVLEYAEGGALDDKKPDGTYKYLPASEETVLQIVKEVSAALDVCHKNGIIHRDIKPGNLFYRNTDGSGVLIGDFGIASAFEADQGMSKHLTKTGNAQTIGYAAPEMFGGHKDVEVVIGKEVDYYALGITLWALLTGEEPFVNEKGHPLYEGEITLDTIQGKTADRLLARSPQMSGRMQTIIRGLLTVRHDKRWGFSEVSRFLAGENVEVFAEAVRDLPPIEIAGEKCYQYIDVARALLNHREEGKTLVYKGKLAGWLIRGNQEFGEQMQDFADTYSAENRHDEGLVFIAYKLCPSLPFAVGDGKTITSLHDMLSLLETSPESLVPFLRDEKAGFFSYLDAVGLGAEGKKVKELVQAVRSNFKLVPRLAVALKGNAIKPFQDKVNNDRELREIEHLDSLPEYLKERALLFIERRCGELPAWIENLTGKNLELWLHKLDHQEEKLAGWGRWKYFTLFLRGTDIQSGTVVEKDGKKGFNDPFGTELLSPVWEDVCAGITGSFIVRQNGKWGVVKADGSVILPFDYHTIEVFNEERHWYNVSVLDQITREEEWRIIGEDGNVLQSKRNEPFHIIGAGDRRFFWNQENGRVVIRNEKGETVQECSWSGFEEYNGAQAAVFQEHGKSGIASAEGAIIVPAEYDRIVIHGNGARYFVRKNGKWGILNPKDNSFLVPGEYDTLQCNGGTGVGYILQKGGMFDVYFGKIAAVHGPAVCHIVKKDSRFVILDPQKNELAAVPYIREFAQTFDEAGWSAGDIAFRNNAGVYCLLKCCDGGKFLAVNVKTRAVSERSPDPGDGAYLQNNVGGDRVWQLINSLKKQNRFTEMNLLVNATGLRFFSEGDLETARRIFWFIKPDNMEGLDKSYDLYRWMIGKTLELQQNHEDAVMFFEEAVNINPLDANYYSDCSDSCARLHRYEKALEYADGALKINPRRGLFLFNKGAALYGLKRNDEAVACFSQALEEESDPQSRALYLKGRGNAYKALGLRDKADDDYREAKNYG